MEQSPASEVKSLSYAMTSITLVKPAISVLCQQQLDSFTVHPERSTNTHTRSLRSNLLSYHQCFCLPRLYLLEIFQPKLLRSFLISSVRATCPSQHIFLDFSVLNIFSGVYKLCRFRLCCFFQPLATEISLSIMLELSKRLPLKSFWEYLLSPWCTRMYNPFHLLVISLWHQTVN